MRYINLRFTYLLTCITVLQYSVMAHIRVNVASRYWLLASAKAISSCVEMRAGRSWLR